MNQSREFKWIEAISRWVEPLSSRVVAGIGDDAAVLLPPKGKLLATIDMMVEGVHFDWDYCLPEEVGHKLLAMSLSDIAAMAGIPRQALVSLAVPTGTETEKIEALYRGLRALAGRFEVDIVGGNLSSARTGMVLDLCLLGEAQTPILRSGARPGDRVAVTGKLGASAAGLQALKRWGREACRRFPEETARHLKPEPRVREAQALAVVRALTALIDISDGLSSELHHLAEASGVGIRIESTSLPISKGTRAIADELGGSALEWALNGGEDYELLLALSPDALPRLAGVAELTVIGTVTRDGGVAMADNQGKWQPLPAGGWQHSV